MKRQCFCVRHWRMALGLVLIPPLFWLVLLSVLPTHYARTKIADRLSAASGRVVKIGALKVGWLGTVRLKDLQIGAPTTGDNPWLSVRSASIDLRLIHLVFGPIEPTNIEVEGMEFRILRRADGSVELADFLNPADPRTVSSSLNEPHGKHLVGVAIRDAKLVLIDEPTGTRLAFDHVQGKVACDGIVTTLSEFRGNLNAGTVQFAARFDRAGARPKFEGQVRARDVSVDEGMGALGYLLPLLPSGREKSTEKMEGRLALDLHLEGEGNSRADLRKSLVGNGRIDIDPISLAGSSTLNDLVKLLQVPAKERYGSARGDLQLKEGRIISENLTLNVAKAPLTFTGWTELDGAVNFRLKTDGISGRIPENARDYLRELADIDLKQIVDIQVQGTVDAPKVLFDGLPLADSSGNGLDGDRRLREISRKLRDRIRR